MYAGQNRKEEAIKNIHNPKHPYTWAYLKAVTKA